MVSGRLEGVGPSETLGPVGTTTISCFGFSFVFLSLLKDTKVNTNLKRILSGLICLLLTSESGGAQSVHLLCLQVQNQIWTQANFTGFSKASSPSIISANVVRPLNWPITTNKTAKSVCKVGKIMMIAGGAIYLIGGMTVATHGQGNLEAGTAIAATGAVVCAAGIPLYFIGRHNIRHAK